LSTDQKLVPVTLVDFDFVITKDKLEEDDDMMDFITPKSEFRTEALGDCNLSAVSAGTFLQIDRKGFYRVDSVSDGKIVLFKVPTGKSA
jgi:glutamyl-tRNA synthetase